MTPEPNIDPRAPRPTAPGWAITDDLVYPHYSLTVEAARLWHLAVNCASLTPVADIGRGPDFPYPDFWDENFLHRTPSFTVPAVLSWLKLPADARGRATLVQALKDLEDVRIVLRYQGNIPLSHSQATGRILVFRIAPGSSGEELLTFWIFPSTAAAYAQADVALPA